MSLFDLRCPSCGSTEYKRHTGYQVEGGEERTIYHCPFCDDYFSETANTALADLKTPLSRISQILKAVNEGIGINAACRTFQVGKQSIKRWLQRVGEQREALQLYALCHQFIEQLVEGDELYTKVGENKPAMLSEGWTIVLMERASRFLWELDCGQRQSALFERAMQTLSQVIAQTQDLTLLTDGERRYANLLFDLCQTVIRTGEVGRPRKTLPPGVKVRRKNKGSQAHQPGRKRPKYETPKAEHPTTPQTIENQQIHANHLEAFNSALRRKLVCYRRQTNTYAKTQPFLQTRLDVHWILHNFLFPHFTTKQVPAVAIGILSQPLTWSQLFRIQSLTPLPP